MIENLVFAKNITQTVTYMKKGYTVLAGGTEINRLDSPVDARDLVSIGRIEGLDTIAECDLVDYPSLRIGATATFQEVIDSDLVPSYFKEACHFMASRTRRNMATIGGNIALKRDDSYLWSVLLAVKAWIEIRKGRKAMIVSALSYLEKESLENPLILSVIIPTQDISVLSKRYANTQSSHGYITMTVCSYKGQLCAGLCVKNSGIHFITSKDGLSDIRLRNDMFGSESYKRYLIGYTYSDLVSKVGGKS